MQTITVEITNQEVLKALEDLQEKDLIKILGKSDSVSCALPGEPLSEQEFRDWVMSRENGPTVSFQEAKAIGQRKESISAKSHNKGS